jgi:hypothetical protein
MNTLSYEALRAEQAWQIIAEQLDRRNTLLARGIGQMERDPAHLPTASRLMILRYHLRHSLRQLSTDTRQRPAPANPTELVGRQWMHIRQLALLLTQIDHELADTRRTNRAFRGWLREQTTDTRVMTPTYLN